MRALFPLVCQHEHSAVFIISGPGKNKIVLQPLGAPLDISGSWRNARLWEGHILRVPHPPAGGKPW